MKKEKQAKQLTCELNKKFSKLSKAEKRVALAKDVLLQIKAKLLVIDTGNYVLYTMNITDNPIEETDQFQKVANNMECKVCAKGALFIADIVRRDKMTVEEANTNSENKIVNRLSGIYSKKQLDLIEAAFETSWFSWQVFGQPDATKAIKFGTRYSNLTNRLIAIMKNIIENEGEFKP